ncbi:hypothetical protein CRENBAI_014107 [Crenichthys baileyi]|uniref:Uncharacterized protein n=1 Tax=Crenichthys baileyi TaxID=28760 RepID=A0AAV9RJU5_9TELE
MEDTQVVRHVQLNDGTRMPLLGLGTWKVVLLLITPPPPLADDAATTMYEIWYGAVGAVAAEVEAVATEVEAVATEVEARAKLFCLCVLDGPEPGPVAEAEGALEAADGTQLGSTSQHQHWTPLHYIKGPEQPAQHQFENPYLFIKFANLFWCNNVW